jgi:hypothetical protein
MNHLSDIILFPLYVALFALFFSWRRKKIEDPILKKYHRTGFWIKVFSAFAYIIYSLNLAKLDSVFLYYPEGVNIAKLILKDTSNIKLLFTPGIDFDSDLLADSLNKGYFKSESNYFIARLVTIFSFFSFGSYSVITLIFSMISFAGVWRLYRFFYDQYPHLHKAFAIAILYLPNFVFWSSGILKDPLCTGMMGFMTYGLYKVIIKKESVIKNTLAILISATVLALVKDYILASYLPFLLLFFAGNRIQKIERPAVKAMLITFIGIVSLIVFFLTQDLILGSVVDKLAESVQDMQTNFMNLSGFAESTFNLGAEFDGTPAGLLKIAPFGIVASLYRPFLWEAKSVTFLLSAIESSAVIFFTLYVFFKAGPLTFFKSIIKDPMILFCFLFAMMFSLFVGVTTLNFGTLVRYKIPCMPFYIIALVLILDGYKRKALLKAAAHDEDINIIGATPPLS